MSDIKQISFKSVGIKRTDEEESVPNENIPIGFKLPMQLGTGVDGVFAMNYEVRDEIRQSMKNLLLTNWGERLGLYRFGANLQAITFELGTDEFDNELAVRIRTAVSRWMPYVSLDDLQRFSIRTQDNTVMAQIKARVFYSVPVARIEKDAVSITFFIAA